MNLNGNNYYYIRNAQGDIIGLIDGTGTQVVSYTYDTWGKLISISGSLKDTVGVLNPYRYRGYRYDTETGFYYLQSRYYNPEWGRFINADATCGEIGDLLSHNIFAYCNNNSVNTSDPTGHFALSIWLLGEAIGEAVGTVTAVLSSPVVAAFALVAGACLLGYAIYNYCSNSTSSTSSRSSSKSSSSKSSRNGGGSNTPNNKPNRKKTGKGKKITTQLHHFLTNKNSRYTPLILETVTKYSLDLDDDWNKEFMQHMGRHCNNYHEYMLDAIDRIDSEANGDIEIFLDKFEQIKDYIKANPDKLYRRGW